MLGHLPVPYRDQHVALQYDKKLIFIGLNTYN